MASIYKRKRSPFWWIKCRDANPQSPTVGQTIQFSTGMKVGVGADTRRANQMCAERTLAETKTTANSPSEPWNVWVTDYLKAYCKTVATLTRYQTMWRNLSLFLSEHEINLPRQLNLYPLLRVYGMEEKAGSFHRQIPRLPQHSPF